MTFASSDMDWLAGLLAETARAEIMPRFRRLGDGDIRQKTSAADLVTEADVNAERVITAALRERYPQARIIGEEAVSDDPALLDADWSSGDLAFTLDPVDGTFNFASGVACFGVMLAVVSKGETVAGIIHDPVGGDWVMAEKGAGAVLRAPDSGRIVAFANLLRGGAVECSADLMRHDPGAPGFVMDALFAEVLLWAAAQGFRWFNLGAAPFSGSETRALASPWQRLGGFVYEHGDEIYHFEGLRAFKDKFQPVWTPNYIACDRGLGGGLGVARAFMDANLLISGGVAGLMRKGGSGDPKL